MGLPKDQWVWMPHAGHLIVGKWCQFHLFTYVGDYVVSTLGEYLPDEGVREIMADCRGVVLEGQGDARLADYMQKIGFEDIGFDRKYETMVFKALRMDVNPCCPYQPIDWSNEDGEGYNSAHEAFEGHLRMCEKWAGEQTQP